VPEDNVSFLFTAKTYKLCYSSFNVNHCVLYIRKLGCLWSPPEDSTLDSFALPLCTTLPINHCSDSLGFDLSHLWIISMFVFAYLSCGLVCFWSGAFLVLQLHCQWFMVSVCYLGFCLVWIVGCFWLLYWIVLNKCCTWDPHKVSNQWIITVHRWVIKEMYICLYRSITSPSSLQVTFINLCPNRNVMMLFYFKTYIWFT